MKFLIDNALSEIIAEGLQQAGYDAIKEIIQTLRPQPNANINLPNAKFGGGFAGKNYSGDVENIMNQLSESHDKKEIKQLLQQLIDKLEQDKDKDKDKG